MDSSTFVIVWLICALLGWVIGSSKGKAGLGFILGLLLGILGLIIILVVSPAVEAPDGKVSCPSCAEKIQPAATVCPHCGRDVEPAVMQPAAANTAEGWLADPSGRHPDRWWDGSQWTHWVRDAPGGTRSEDPPLMRL